MRIASLTSAPTLTVLALATAATWMLLTPLAPPVTSPGAHVSALRAR